MISAARFDVTGIGNAIVDVIATADDAFLADRRLTKGIMSLIDADEAERLYDAMGPGREMSGGSAGNTMAGIASLGGTGAYIGKVAADQLGGVFRHDIRAVGCHYETAALEGGAPTARCLILVTPDAQRTMNTYLGASVELQPQDIDPAVIGDSQVTYLEGYLYDRDLAKAAFHRAADIAHEAGRQVSLSLSDPFCVARHRDAFRDLVKNRVDILFANEAEILSLYETQSIDAAVAAVREDCGLAAVTLGDKGSLLVTPDTVVPVAAEPIQRLVDTTGAGDLYAAGVLFGLTHGLGLAESGRIGSIAAAQVIQAYGARTEARLADLVAGAGLAPVRAAG